MQTFIKLILFTILFSSKLVAQQIENIFLITTDGYRWQELFHGADSTILFNSDYVSDVGILSELYWISDLQERRKKLMPFVWNYIEKHGQIWGNRDYNNKVSVANPFCISYAGYNELLKGCVDLFAFANIQVKNTKTSILNYLQSLPAFKDKVAMFTSWNLFEYIHANTECPIPSNCGYEQMEDKSLSAIEVMVNQAQEKSTCNTLATRSDVLTYTLAQEYIKKNHPRVLYIGFGETDEAAHAGKYCDYLQYANNFDKFLSSLWQTVQSDPFYKNKTSFIITTDHGRGNGKDSWKHHSFFISGSKQTWLMQLGPNIAPLGEVKSEADIKAVEIAQTMAEYLGICYKPRHQVWNSSYALLGNTQIYQVAECVE